MDFETNNMESRDGLYSSLVNGETKISDIANEEDQGEDSDLSNVILSYMNQFLVEENVDDMGCVLGDSLNLRMPPAFGDANPTIGIDFGPVMSEFRPVSDLANDPTNARLRYMNQILMEEDAEDTGCMVQGSLKLQEAEKSLYEAIGKKYPPSPARSFHYSGQNSEGGVGNTNTTSSSLDGVSGVSDGLVESRMRNVRVDSGSESVSLFIKGVEEASKLIPNIEDFFVGSKAKGLSKKQAGNLENSSKGKKHGHGSSTELSEEGRSSKQANAYADPDVHSNIFDEILLHHAGDKNKAFVAFREALQNEAIKRTQRNGHPKVRQEPAMVDLKRLLINCAEAVAADAKEMAHVLLNQIRLHSSPLGDGIQRLAYYLANGLEARLAGTGSQIYRSLACKRPSAISMLKAYQLYLAACPFNRVSQSFSSITIWKRTRGAPRVHIIDFGILYGFQWPSFLQRISKVRDGPPRIRITGIEFPQPGFRPAERVEETGRRLAHYAKEFNVPFEFNPIAKRWEAIQVEDLKLDENEVVVVNCIYRMKNLPDETTMVLDCSSSRSAVLSMIRKTNPVVFIQGVVNGAYNAPSFLTRFREAFFHFSTHFDMLDSIVPRESEDRVLLEGEVLGREAFNVMACEGWDRVERPETYRQWHTRTSQAGFEQFPIDPALKDRAKLRASAYCKEFVIDQDGLWLILGWKGKILYALSTWKPA